MYVKIISLAFLILPFSLSSCSETGILATIASSKKIEKGSLPQKISVQNIFHIAPDDTTKKYYFVSAGSGLYYKDVSTDGIWKPLSLTANGESWDGVQSAAATGEHIFIATYRYDDETKKYTVGIQKLNSLDSSGPKYTPLGKKWESDSSFYKTIRLFVPKPDDVVYVNVLKYDGEYASLDSGNNNFRGSELYKLDPAAKNWETGATLLGKLSSELDKRYVKSIATSHDVANRMTIISAVGNESDNSSGILLTVEKENPIIKVKGDLKEGTPLTALTWLKRDNLDSNGAFIAAATASTDENFPIYASEDGVDWIKLGITSSYKISSFVDISNTTAGKPDSKELVLAGTASYISNRVSKKSYGYIEIDVSSDEIRKWSLVTNRSSYLFADRPNYSSSKLSSASINSLTVLSYNGSEQHLFASTAFNGLWKASLNTPSSKKKPEWTHE